MSHTSDGINTTVQQNSPSYGKCRTHKRLALPDADDNDRFTGNRKDLALRWAMRKWRRSALRELWFKLFLFFERFGVHVLPKSFYTPIQDFHWLTRNKALWINRSRLSAIDLDVNKQMAWLTQTCHGYYHEVEGLAVYRQIQERNPGPGYGPIESQVLHCFIRSHAPRRIVEIGSGCSTMCMVHAATLNEQEGRPPSQITCVEPYPSEALQNLPKVTLIKQVCQAVSSSVFCQLQAGDLLFVDSSHAVKVGSDVIRIYLEIVPNLPAGVFIHVHDINLPYLYDRSTLSSYYTNNSQETALLAALLIGNSHLSVLAALSALHYDASRDLGELLSDYHPQANEEGLCPSYPPKGTFPNSVWIKTCQ
jgi:predicted O-methyltransferase YrrM